MLLLTLRRAFGVVVFLTFAGTAPALEGDLADLRRKAAAGDPGAMAQLGQRYTWTTDAELAQDYEQARFWFTKAAAKGNGYAAGELAKMFVDGIGGPANREEAFKWMLKAAEAGNHEAQIQLADWYETGDGVKRNLVEAFKWNLKAAEQGDSGAQYRAGLALLEGRGTKPDPVAAVKWFQQAMDEGHEEAGAKYWELRQADPELGKKMLAAAGAPVKALLARAAAGDAKAQVELALKMGWGTDGLLRDEAMAAEWWQKAADGGAPEAQIRIGRNYLFGEGVDQDRDQGIAWLQKAAAQNFPEAFLWLGAIHGEYTSEPNHEEANRYYRRGAELGNGDCQKRLGLNLQGGHGAKPNPKEALAWYVKSAEQGDPQAMLLAGMLASDDDPAVRNLTLAKTWLEKSHDLGVIEAEYHLERLNAEVEKDRLVKNTPAHVPEPLRAAYVEGLLGNRTVALEFAERYRSGRDGLPRDNAEALKWLRRSAEAGDKKAMELLGDAYLEGAIVTKNIDEAVLWLGKAAEIWSTTAAVKLADLHLSGALGPKSETEAARWLEHVAAGDRDVMWRLSRMYAKGLDGGAPLPEKAERWLNLSAGLKQPDAEKEIARVRAEREAARVAQAKAADDVKYAAAQQTLETDFAAAASRAEREAAVRKFSSEVSSIGHAQRLTQPQIAERVLQVLLPKMEARLDEAGAYLLAINSQAFDKAVFDRVAPARVRDAAKAYSQRVVNEFNASQQALAPIQSLIPAAEAGDVAKQIQIAEYLMQNHAARSEEGAARWYKKAADAGNPVAKQRLEAIAQTWFDRGYAAYQADKYATALTEFKRAAEAGSSAAQFNVGNMYYLGVGVPQKDYIEAAKRYRLSAEQSFPNAMYMLGHVLRHGEGVPADEAAALVWYRRAAEKGNAAAKDWAAVLDPASSIADRAALAFEKGRGLAGTQSGAKGYGPQLDFVRYAAKLEHPEAKALLAQVDYVAPPHPADQQFAAGFAAFQAKRFDEALRIWTEAAAKGHPIATFNIGTFYENGSGVTADQRKAVEWYEKAVALNYPNARTALAKLKRLMLLNDGLAAYNAKKFAEAKIAWEESAALGNADAMFNLGVLYVQGLGVEKNLTTGLSWYEKGAAGGVKNAPAAVADLKIEIVFQEGLTAYNAKKFDAAISAWEKAAALGSSYAYYNLGAMTETGEAFNGDLKRALDFYEKAAAAGHQAAPEAVAAMKQRLIGYDEMQAAQKARAARKDDEALAWYEKAAAAGSEEGARMVKFMKAQRVGIAELKQGQAAADDGEFDEAIAWYTKAADLGNVTAMTSLATLYQFGRGVDEDPRKAIAWYDKAEDHGDSFSAFEAENLAGSLSMFDLMASQPAMKKLRDQIDGVAAAAPVAAPKGPKTGMRARDLRKRAPWTATEIQQALKDGADPQVLANVIEVDKTADNFTDLALKRLMISPEGQRIEDGSRLSKTLYRHARQGGGSWTNEMAKAAIEARRQQIGRLPKVVDSPELRAKAAAGDVAALFHLTMEMLDADLKHGPRPELAPGELAAKVLAGKYAPGYWLVADGFRYNPDKSQNDPVRRAELLFESAAAGSPRGMRELAMEFLTAGDDVAIAGSCIEAEYWLIEAAARAPEGYFNDPVNMNPERDVAFLYAFRKPLGGPTSWAISIVDESSLRWARELLRRGGATAEVADVALQEFELERMTKGARTRMNALPPEVPLWSAAEVTKLEAAAKAGDAAAALKLGDAYASGRGVRQNDVKAVALYQVAAGKGAVKAMRALASQHGKGFGAKKDLSLQAAWLEKAGAAGDAAAWLEAADISHFWIQDHAAGYPRALAAYEKAIAGGIVPAFRQLAMMHELGRGVPVDLVKAEALLTRGATAGDVEAQSRLGSLLFKAKRFAEAATWYGKAAEGGQGNMRFSQAEALEKSGDKPGAIAAYRQYVKIHPDGFQAQMQLGLLLEEIKDWTGARECYRAVLAVNSNYNTYRDWAKSRLAVVEEELNPPAGGEVALRRKAESGDPQAMIDYARLIAKARRPEALEWLKKSAELGYAPAMLMLSGELMATDKAAGIEWMKKSAAGGNPEAKYRLGSAMYAGKEIPLDQAGGVKLVQEASDAGFAPAQFDIGRNLVIGGLGFAPDPARGVELLKQSAAQGMPQAMMVLGEIFEKGVAGITANPREALRWYEQAKRAGVQQAQPMIERLQIVLSGKTPPPAKK